jgi:hypothetical protein
MGDDAPSARKVFFCYLGFLVRWVCVTAPAQFGEFMCAAPGGKLSLLIRSDPDDTDWAFGKSEPETLFPVNLSERPEMTFSRMWHRDLIEGSLRCEKLR